MEAIFLNVNVFQSLEETAAQLIEKIDGRYYYEALDGGVKFRNILSAFVQDGKVLFDGIMRDESYNPE